MSFLLFYFPLLPAPFSYSPLPSVPIPITPPTACSLFFLPSLCLPAACLFPIPCSRPVYPFPTAARPLPQTCSRRIVYQLTNCSLITSLIEFSFLNFSNFLEFFLYFLLTFFVFFGIIIMKKKKDERSKNEHKKYGNIKGY